MMATDGIAVIIAAKSSIESPVTTEATSLNQDLEPDLGQQPHQAAHAVDTGAAVSAVVEEGQLAHPSQQEMPFAVVQGKELTILPKDLYIPPDALEVFLEAFEGPLDLLLYLIRRQNLDIL